MLLLFLIRQCALQFTLRVRTDSSRVSLHQMCLSEATLNKVDAKCFEYSHSRPVLCLTYLPVGSYRSNPRLLLVVRRLYYIRYIQQKQQQGLLACSTAAALLTVARALHASNACTTRTSTTAALLLPPPCANYEKFHGIIGLYKGGFAEAG